MFRQFLSAIDYKKLINMQASQTSPYSKAVDIKKNPKNMKTSSYPKTKKLGRRK